MVENLDDGTELVEAEEDFKQFHVHLVSDATGETISSVARACLAQFRKVRTIEHVYPLVRSPKDAEKVLAAVKRRPGVVMYTLVNPKILEILEAGCRELDLPAISVLSPVIGALAGYFDESAGGRPGSQHEMNADYFHRIEAMNFVLAHDDGQMTHDLNEADIIVVGVSRTSKTPTCIYLANRGLKAANVPLVPGVPLPEELLTATRPIIVGLTKEAKALVQIRRNRLRMLKQDSDTDYTDYDTVAREVMTARRVYGQYGWPVINVTRRSVEETAAAIYQIYTEKKGIGADA